jgi:hypothetical protein
MRHVVKTINSLPSDFSGDLTILLNDVTVPIACRNLTLLFVLGMIPDEALAADVALHFGTLCFFLRNTWHRFL